MISAAFGRIKTRQSTRVNASSCLKAPDHKSLATLANMQCEMPESRMETPLYALSRPLKLSSTQFTTSMYATPHLASPAGRYQARLVMAGGESCSKVTATMPDYDSYSSSQPFIPLDNPRLQDQPSWPTASNHAKALLSSKPRGSASSINTHSNFTANREA